MSEPKPKFNPPPGWPTPPVNWSPPKGWTPDPSWPAPPPGWQLWINDSRPSATPSESPVTAAIPKPPPVVPMPSAAPPTATLPHAPRSPSSIPPNDQRTTANPLDSDNDFVLLDDDQILQEIGIYRYHHPLENAVAYQERLVELCGRIADVAKGGEAIKKSNMFTFNNSLAQGRRMTSDLSKLMLRAYNAEADNSIRSLRAGNVVTAKKRLEASRSAIKKLGAMMEMHISDRFHALRIEEVELTADFLMKKQEEREAAREERERLREERKVAAELALEKEHLEKERNHLVNAIQALGNKGQSDPDLQQKLASIDKAIEQNDYRSANIRAGYVYVISNRGAFGSNVVKIGLTRRLEPIERVNELGGASVPFHFDVHALFFSEDAVTLETQLHQFFADRRVNQANLRKEFFFATPAEVRDALASKLGNLLEFTEHAESTEYLQSVRYWPDGKSAGLVLSNVK